MLLNYVLPAIRAKWLKNWAGTNDRNTIFVQQDNAKLHISENNASLASTMIQDGFDIQLVNQPPNSFYINVLVLDFFSKI